jgi:MFS family permease
LLGSAALVLLVGARPDRFAPPRVLQFCAAAMAVTGVVFAFGPPYGVLLAVAVVGPLNPSGGDVSAFLPAEQALLSEGTDASNRTARFARYSLVGYASGAAGALMAGLPKRVGKGFGWRESAALEVVFWVYSAVGVAVFILYARIGKGNVKAVTARRLGQSRVVVRRLAMLFSIDAAGGGMVGNALVAVWLDRRYHFSIASIGLLFSASGLLSATSALSAPHLARRLGLVRTMVFTHLPANGFLIAAALAPNARLAVAFLLVRSLLSQLDVPARQSLVMSLVTPEERAAAASYTNVPRSLAAATTPAIGGWLLARSSFGWPLVIGGVAKIAYDLALLASFGKVDDGTRSTA